MVIYPGVGKVAIELSYDGGVEMVVAWWVCGVTWVGLVGFMILGKKTSAEADAAS